MGFNIRRPDEGEVRQALSRATTARSTVPHAVRGASRDGSREDEARRLAFAVDRGGGPLGSGEDVFRRAVEGLTAWEQYPPVWTEILGGRAELGAVVVARLCTLGLWSLNPCRVVEATVDARIARVSIETLEGHAECGEERFSVLLKDDGEVVYEITAVSKPYAALARLGGPVVRRLQHRFRVESHRALRARVTRG
jgi:uncharacterized protein (UPF0548 family)